MDFTPLKCRCCERRLLKLPGALPASHLNVLSTYEPQKLRVDDVTYTLIDVEPTMP